MDTFIGLLGAHVTVVLLVHFLLCLTCKFNTGGHVELALSLLWSAVSFQLVMGLWGKLCSVSTFGGFRKSKVSFLYRREQHPHRLQYCLSMHTSFWTLQTFPVTKCRSRGCAGKICHGPGSDPEWTGSEFRSHLVRGCCCGMLPVPEVILMRLKVCISVAWGQLGAL